MRPLRRLAGGIGQTANFFFKPLIVRSLLCILSVSYTHLDVYKRQGPSQGSAQLIAKQDGVLAGLKVFERVFWLLDPSVKFETEYQDGQAVKCGTLIGTVFGDMRVLLSGERTALNYLQRMSGIATVSYTHLVLL